MKQEIYNLLLKYNCNWNDVYEAIKNKEKINDIKLSNINFIALSEAYYFDKFKEMYLPPFCIFYKGNVNLLNTKIISLFYKITKNNFNDLECFKNKNYTICTYYKNINKSLLSLIIESKINIILVYDKNIENEKDYNSSHLVMISEVCSDNINLSPKQDYNRITYALADKIFLRDSYNIAIDNLYKNNYYNEPKKSYYYNIKVNNSYKYIKNFTFIKINSIDEIFSKKICINV